MREVLFMKYLWNCLTREKPEHYKPYRCFVFLHTILCALPGFVVALVISLCFSFQAAETVTCVGIVTGYIGVFVGLFGGVIYLMREEGDNHLH